MELNNKFKIIFYYTLFFIFCSFNGLRSVVGYPSNTNRLQILQDSPQDDKKTKNSSISAEKCDQYSKLKFKKEEFFSIAIWDRKATPQEFPHMALLGYGNTTEKKEDFKCGGSLISERWILTAAMCHTNHRGYIAKWARLGDYDINSTSDIAQTRDYRIVEHIMHPGYKPRSQLYNDIALFRLEKDVEFSAYMRPICLNSDPSLSPMVMIASGWGTTKQDQEPGMSVLSKVFLNNVPINECNKTYYSKDRPSLNLGILPDSMICAGSIQNREDACWGFGGGPLQVTNDLNKDTYIQIGITSFGFSKCGIKEKPGVYTRVSKYIKWIEQIVW